MIPMRLLLAFVLLLAAACGRGGSRAASDSLATRDTLTRHQKDSILAQSAIPGASVVGRAIAVQDSGASRQAQIESAGREP